MPKESHKSGRGFAAGERARAWAAKFHQSRSPRPTDKVAWGAASAFGQQVDRLGDLRRTRGRTPA